MSIQLRASFLCQILRQLQQLGIDISTLTFHHSAREDALEVFIHSFHDAGEDMVERPLSTPINPESYFRLGQGLQHCTDAAKHVCI
jgi:hypothetical protein